MWVVGKENGAFHRMKTGKAYLIEGSGPARHGENADDSG